MIGSFLPEGWCLMTGTETIQPNKEYQADGVLVFWVKF